MSMTEEKTLWEGSPSQAINFGAYVLCGLLVWLIVPLFVAIWKWLETRSLVYEITTERLRFRYGIFNKRLEEIELYRVRDTSLDEPFFLRLFGAGNIVVQTTDASTPTLVLRAIRGAEEVREHLRQGVEAVRDRKRVRAIEFEPND